MLSLLVATTLASSSPSLQLRSSKHDRPVVHQQLRGGADAPAPSPPATAPAPTALTPEQITEKLNGVPVFCIMNKEGGIISMRDPDGGEQPVCRWFVDANEATMVLKAAIEANPGVEGLHIGVHGLGNAFKLCGGWTDEVMPEVKATLQTGGDSQSVSFRLQGNHALVQETSKQLQDSLKSDGFDALAWQLYAAPRLERCQHIEKLRAALLPLCRSRPPPPGRHRPIFFSEELQARCSTPRPRPTLASSLTTCTTTRSTTAPPPPPLHRPHHRRTLASRRSRAPSSPSSSTPPTWRRRGSRRAAPRRPYPRR